MKQGDKKKQSLRYLAAWAWGQSRGSRLRIVVASLCGILRVACGLSFVWMSKTLVDEAVSGSHSSTTYIWQLSAVMAALMLAEMAMSLLSSYLSNQTEVRVANRMRRNLYSSLLDAPIAGADNHHTGDMLNRLNEDVRVISDAVCRSVPEVVVMLVQLVAAFGLLYVMSPVLALCIVGIMPVCLLFSKLYLYKMRSITANVRRSDSLIHSNMQEGLQHRIVVQTLECHDDMVGRLRALQANLYNEVMHRTRFNTFSRSMMRIGFIGGYLTAFIWSVWHLHTGAITFGMMTAFLQLVARVQNPVINLSHYLPTFVHATASVDRLIEIGQITVEHKQQTEVGAELKSPLGIRFSHVDFAYPLADEDANNAVLHDFSFDFRPASKTVIMGETGVGKSTLTKLILALLQPDAGQIDIYDAEGKSATISDATRRYMVYVPQGNSLLDGTIRDNLLLSKPDATDYEIAEALHTAVADFVYSLPDGLDTRCGELGSGLSEGQCQRIAIARALLRRRPVIILDEFNSSLDVATADLLMKRLFESQSDATVICISHRGEVSEFCDDVLRL